MICGLRLCRQLKGQFVYAGFIDIAGEQYIATIKLDDSAASENAFFKDITIKKRSLYVGQTQDLTPANVIPPADRDITVQQLVEFVKSDFADSLLFTENIPPVKNKKALRAAIDPEELVDGGGNRKRKLRRDSNIGGK